ncbi:hypothetical protein CYMTET_18880 [Cymbomonas tetramitiformis]|uniref:Transposase-associated domain-containing protein n=1 Tax=Cymbomonas tetramitiformis TaxID=36881 RepID=A0AAE0G787_9CHLO|nr:hypothetical protein CYMTET_18880 [Cymbomonas tetramitiformis]
MRRDAYCSAKEHDVRPYGRLVKSLMPYCPCKNCRGLAFYSNKQSLRHVRAVGYFEAEDEGVGGEEGGGNSVDSDEESGFTENFEEEEAITKTARDAAQKIEKCFIDKAAPMDPKESLEEIEERSAVVANNFILDLLEGQKAERAIASAHHEYQKQINGELLKGTMGALPAAGSGFGQRGLPTSQAMDVQAAVPSQDRQSRTVREFWDGVHLAHDIVSMLAIHELTTPVPEEELLDIFFTGLIPEAKQRPKEWAKSFLEDTLALIGDGLMVEEALAAIGLDFVPEDAPQPGAPSPQ